MKTLMKLVAGIALAAAVAGCAEQSAIDAAVERVRRSLSSTPLTCEAAESAGLNSAGCEFFGILHDGSVDDRAMVVTLANPQQEEASFEIWGSVWDSEAYNTTNIGEWQRLAMGVLPAGETKTVEVVGIVLNNFGRCYMDGENPKGLIPEGAYKVIADLPITVAQTYSPIEGIRQYSADGSLLLPVAAWSDEYQVVGYRSTSNVEAGSFAPNFALMELAYAAVVAAEDNTLVTILPSTMLRRSHVGWEDDDVVVPATDEAFTVALNEADVLFIHADRLGESLSGTRITSANGKKVALAVGHQCALVPESALSCDQLEEQIPGVEYWGQQFVAARMPNRNEVDHSDPVLWQIHASEDNTQVRFAAASRVRGLPDAPVTLDAGEVYEMAVYGSAMYPGDFRMDASAPVAVLQYMTGSAVTIGADGAATEIGDPSLVYTPPVDHFQPHHVVHSVEQWEGSYLVVTREAGRPVLLDGEYIDGALFRGMPRIDAGEGLFEVARVPVIAGAHVIESSGGAVGLGVLLVGMKEDASYAYPAGMAQ